MERASVQSDGATIRVILANSQAIFRVGISKILSSDPSIRVVGQAESLGSTIQLLSTVTADILLFETAISPTPSEAISELLRRWPSLFMIALVDGVRESETVDYLRRGVRGLVTCTIAPDLLLRCIHKVALGETWLDSRSVNWVIKAFRNQAAQTRPSDGRARLSERELLIISGVTQGLRNKEVAQEIGTTEQVVKNYLRKIYDKLGIKDRLELAMYAAAERLLEGGRSSPVEDEMECADSPSSKN